MHVSNPRIFSQRFDEPVGNDRLLVKRIRYNEQIVMSECLPGRSFKFRDKLVVSRDDPHHQTGSREQSQNRSQYPLRVTEGICNRKSHTNRHHLTPSGSSS
ncbi:MAG: hypothetical protein KatS3mg112_0500 [Thermogutta sp.]|nr:MAG: hypothetical protein KatS3mg112_0500 [Thermogutta sp.]